MKFVSQFIVLIERSRWRPALAAACSLLALSAAMAVAGRAFAGEVSGSKIALDLQQVIAAPTTPSLSWTRDVKKQRMVKALVLLGSDDGDMASLRGDILARGGAVYVRYLSVPALSVMLPASQVAAIAARGDVQSISPNRVTARSASVLESSTGTLSPAVRRYPETGGYTGLDGSGVGIAVLDSGIERNHASLKAADGKKRRVQDAVDFQQMSDVAAMGVKDWKAGIDASDLMVPGSRAMADYLDSLTALGNSRPDPYGHGTHVASIAAGRGAHRSPDSTGIAPGATLFDLRVLDSEGNGQMSDTLAAIDWVIYHAREYNIRVMNLSLAADSTETWQTDPLARAARSAVAAGITVVAAAGNFGLDGDGRERYGTISSPGHDPSVITVGSANTRGTATRGDDSVSLFSSRGPTRASFTDALGRRQFDNLIKPDLVAPGNRIVGALATDKSGSTDATNFLAATYADLALPFGGVLQPKRQALMNLSGTSVAAPVVSGAVALLLQANPGLTPPLIKAILQYTAQPVAGAGVLQQGAGLLNLDGAVRLAEALRSDVQKSVENGSLGAGASLLAANKSLPSPRSTVNGETFDWGRMVFAGGNQIVSGDALFSQFQPIYDHRLVWASGRVQRHLVDYWPAGKKAAGNTFVKSVRSARSGNQPLLTPGVVQAGALTGSSSAIGRTGLFMPASQLSAWLIGGSGPVLGQGVVLSEGIVLSEGVVLSESDHKSKPGRSKAVSVLGEP